MYVYIFNLKYHWYTIIVDYFFHSKPCLNFNSITNYSLYTMKILTKLQKKKKEWDKCGCLKLSLGKKTDSCTEHIFIEYLLCARHGYRHLGNRE